MTVEWGHRQYRYDCRMRPQTVVVSFYSHIYAACGLILQSYLYCLWPHSTVISIMSVASFYSHIYTACGFILQSYLYCLWLHSTVISILSVASFYSHIYTACGLILQSYLYCLWPHSTVISILPVMTVEWGHRQYRYDCRMRPQAV
jgi:hypothetical protein